MLLYILRLFRRHRSRDDHRLTIVDDHNVSGIPFELATSTAQCSARGTVWAYPGNGPNVAAVISSLWVAVTFDGCGSTMRLIRPLELRISLLGSSD